MSLSDPRVCVIEWCQRERVRDALYCAAHLNDSWRNNLPEPELERREAAWVRRMHEGRLPAKELAA